MEEYGLLWKLVIALSCLMSPRTANSEMQAVLAWYMRLLRGECKYGSGRQVGWEMGIGLAWAGLGWAGLGWVRYHHLWPTTTSTTTTTSSTPAAEAGEDSRVCVLVVVVSSSSKGARAGSQQHRQRMRCAFLSSYHYKKSFCYYPLLEEA